MTQSTPDIVERLRDLRPGYGNIIDDAINEIERLRGAQCSAGSASVSIELMQRVWDMRADFLHGEVALWNTLAEAATEIESLRTQLESARKALEFYAEPKNYSDDYWKGMWETARAALKDIQS